MSFWRCAFTVFLKDLDIELRSKEIILSTVLFAILIVLLSAFAFGLNNKQGGDTAAGILWIAVSFGGILALNRTFLREREFNVWSAVLMTPAPKGALYLGKVLGTLFFLFIVELILFPIIELFFHAPMLSNLVSLLPILFLGSLGYAAVGTLFGAMTISTRLRDVLLGAILYPLVTPLLIAAVKGSAAFLNGEGWGGAKDYVELLLVIDGIYLLGGIWLFGPIMEE